MVDGAEDGEAICGQRFLDYPFACKETKRAMKFEKKADGVFMLNVEGYVCPHPQIYTKKALETLGKQ